MGLILYFICDVKININQLILGRLNSYSFFSKMVRSVLRGIRVDSLDELNERISQYINQINEKPVLFTWRYKMEEMDKMPGGITV